MTIWFSSPTSSTRNEAPVSDGQKRRGGYGCPDFKQRIERQSQMSSGGGKTTTTV